MINLRLQKPGVDPAKKKNNERIGDGTAHLVGEISFILAGIVVGGVGND